MEIVKSIAFIMDGNRRWARRHLKEVALGYNAGLETCRTIVTAAFDYGLTDVVVWAGSQSNLEKRQQEKEILFSLLKRELRDRIEKPDEARFFIRGAWQQFTYDGELIALAAEAERRSADVRGRTLTVLFGYSGLTEIAEAATIASQKLCGNITPAYLRAYCWNRHLPDIDLIVRTGLQNGDYHFSDLFLPLHTQHAQLVFSEKLWPDFSVEDFQLALVRFGRRSRRKGE